MPRRRRVVRSHRVVIVALLTAGIGGLLLPQAWTGCLINPAQILVPVQDATTLAVDSVAGALTADLPPVSADVHEALQRRRIALEHQLASLQLRIAELEEENELLTATRLSGLDGQRIGAQGRLLPGRVIAEDLLDWRASRLINIGSLQGVRQGALVASRHFQLDLDNEAANHLDGMAVLRGEVLVGFVDWQVGTQTARVKLLSDATVEMRVRIGRLTEDGLTALEPSFWLTGRGSGVMQIRGVDRRLVQDEAVAVGDIVLSDPTAGSLPAAMTIGRIRSIEPYREKPLLSILTVESPLVSTDLKRVWVFDPEPPTGE